MRGSDVMQEELFILGELDQYVPVDHPLRRVREVFNGCPLRMDTHFDELYSPFGRESIPPEKLLRALMLQVLFGIRSERQLVEQLRYNMLYRWFVGLPLHEHLRGRRPPQVKAQPRGCVGVSSLKPAGSNR